MLLRNNCLFHMTYLRLINTYIRYITEKFETLLLFNIPLTVLVRILRKTTKTIILK